MIMLVRPTEPTKIEAAQLTWSPPSSKDSRNTVLAAVSAYRGVMREFGCEDQYAIARRC